MSERKGIILAGGTGSRLYPITNGISKQLLPVYDKPMIYYPLSVLMMTGVRDIAVITAPRDQEQFQRLLGDGSQWGLSLTYIEQPEPEGLAQAYILAEAFLDGQPSVMALGDNIFFGGGLPQLLHEADTSERGATVLAYHVSDPERYAVVGFGSDGEITQIIEKPENPPSPYAITGLYFMDGTAAERARKVKKSDRDELEITSILESYLSEGTLDIKRMGRGFAWLDTGTHASLLDAGNFVRTLQNRQGLQAGCLEEIAFQAGWINEAALAELAKTHRKSDYGRYLVSLLNVGPMPK